MPTHGQLLPQPLFAGSWARAAAGIGEQGPCKVLEVKPTGRRADLQDFPKCLPARTVAKGFHSLCPAAALLACSLANQRLTLQPVIS